MADFDIKKFFLRWRMYLLAALVAAVVVAILWWVPPLLLGQVGETDAVKLANLEDAYRRTLAQILGGLALLYGLYLTQRRIVAAEDNVRVAQEGQVTERFTRAIEQLGDNKMAIRLGGIYALERLAKDSEKDHGPIMEVLTAYVRERAPRQEEAETLPTDIQAILTVIGRRETTGKDRGNDCLDLAHTQLARAALNGANLRGADLRGADLSMADLIKADLIKANLHGAKLSWAELRGAKLRGANLNYANLISTELGEAELGGAWLRGADLSTAKLGGAWLRGAKLIEANLEEADLRGADLRGADLVSAKLYRADLSTAKNLTAEQVRLAQNWRGAYLPDYLNLPKPPAA